ncbi:ubiquitin [Desulfuribacillus stibiiarsenatis]|uniref:Ubiquitin n=2 Tax=Desulfuribacillus stibiiarsenatis TaxID=1390249 RepID=A0A1E5L7K9_9FIRM|nr:ubiquitin [Desulfuribacillus stibiiarsenatis]
MMVTLELVEKLRDRTGVSYEEAKKALEETNGDILEAVINLERQNRIKTPHNGGYYHSRSSQQASQQTAVVTIANREGSENGSGFGDAVKGFFRWMGRIIHKGNTNNFTVMRNGEKITSIPLTALALLLFFAFWIILPIAIICLFFGYRYSFEGPEATPSVNRAMDTVADAAENLKNDIKNEINK